MTTERKKLSLGNVSARTEGRSAADRTRAWNVSASRQEALKERARDMRRNPTLAQQVLWEKLKDKQCGFTFNREVVMGSAIVDFACKTRWVVVEVGDTEGPPATIAELSDRKLREVGVRVLRFAEADVLEDTDKVVKAVKDELQKPFEKPRMQEGSNAQDR
jgi:very-short-patch-repair endonuclease